MKNHGQVRGGEPSVKSAKVQSPADHPINLKQLPPWLDVLEPNLRKTAIKFHWTGDSSRLRRIAQTYVRWADQLLEAADVVELQTHGLSKAMADGKQSWESFSAVRN
ncbi:hypothetical protein GC207_14725 [bacterium]|nr:hypothetical protein [bacterium]